MRIGSRTDKVVAPTPVSTQEYVEFPRVRRALVEREVDPALLPVGRPCIVACWHCRALVRHGCIFNGHALVRRESVSSRGCSHACEQAHRCPSSWYHMMQLSLALQLRPRWTAKRAAAHGRLDRSVEASSKREDIYHFSTRYPRTTRHKPAY